jgi:RNA polymerase sigma factor (sigma-70 family)
MMPATVMTPTNGRQEPTDIPPSPDRAVEGLSSDSTISLLPLAARGDRQAIDILVERMRPYLRRFGRGRLPRWARSRGDTEDLVDESLIRALKHLPRFENQTIKDFRAWLHTVFRNLVTDEKRFVGRVGVGRELPADVEDPGLSPEEQVVEQAQASVFEQALKRLGPRDRRFIVYRLQHGCSFQELADALDKPSADAARMTYNRALQRFQVEVKRLTSARRPRPS